MTSPATTWPRAKTWPDDPGEGVASADIDAAKPALTYDQIAARYALAFIAGVVLVGIQQRRNR